MTNYVLKKLISCELFFLGKEGFFGVLVFSILVGFVSSTYYGLKEKLELAYADIRKKDQQKSELEVLKAKAELEALQSKINPHFLFNSLNSIAGLISIDAEKAEDMTLKLSELFRSVLKFNNDSFSTIEDELALIKTYLEIETIRFGKRLKYSFNIQKSVIDHKIPQLLIQPIVENALKHGIEPLTKGGEIKITIAEINNKISINVEDNGNGFPKHVSFGYGMTNTKKRLVNLYETNFEFEIYSDEQTRVNIMIPKNR